jgi:hypothetical protein
VCFYNDGESAEFSSGEQIRKSRKDRRCDGCFKPEAIKRGELYSHQSGKFEGDFFTVVLCGSCHRDRNAIHEAELARGCREHESWCHVDEIIEHLPEYSLTRSLREQGQDWLETKREKVVV